MEIRPNSEAIAAKKRGRKVAKAEKFLRNTEDNETRKLLSKGINVKVWGEYE